MSTTVVARARPWLRWHGAKVAAVCGAPGLLAAALLSIAMALYAIVLPRWQAEADRLAAELGQQRREAQHRQALPAVQSDGERLQQLLQALPQSTTATQTEALALLQAGARSAQLELAGGSYQIEQIAGDPVARLDLVLQARGSYAQLRGFAVRMLQAERALALNTVRLTRSGAGEPVVEAEFGFSLFMRAP